MPATGAAYHVQVARDEPDFTVPMAEATGLEEVFYVVSGLSEGRWYHWRVRACVDDGCSTWSSVWRWRVGEESSEPAGRARRYYYVRDHLGSVRATVDEQGTVVHHDDYYPFGLQMPGRSYVAGEPTRENYTGHELDDETGLLYAGARYLDPVIVRWTAVDPLAEKHPDWTPYNYVLGNPLLFIDPDGQQVTANTGGINLANTVRNVQAFAGDRRAQQSLKYDLTAAAIGTAAAFGAAYFGPSLFLRAAENPVTASVAAKEGVDFAAGLVTDAPDPEGFGGGTVGQGARRLLGEAGDAARRAFTASNRQLQKKFKHATDFGITGNFNSENAAKFKDTIMTHVNSSSTQVIQGTYRRQAVTHFYDPNTGINVIQDANGNYISGWRMSEQQREHLLRDGSLGGS